MLWNNYEMEIRRLRPEELPEMAALLKEEGLIRDAALDYSAGVFDRDRRLLAAGSCSGNTLRCLAVRKEARGGGLLGALLEHLLKVQQSRGNFHVFLYTKPSSADFFLALGFTEIVRDENTVFLENRKTGFSDYLRKLQTESTGKIQAGKDGHAFGKNGEESGKGMEVSGESAAKSIQDVGAVVINANPFTLGHQYLIEYAAARCALVHVFVVSEERSLFPASVRRRLAEEGAAHLENVVCHGTGSYLISQATFPAYFLPDQDTATVSQARLEALLFARIAQRLGITARFLGEEPESHMTALYNEILLKKLPQLGIQCRVIPRLKKEGRIVSASFVRGAMKSGKPELAEPLVPETTMEYLRSSEAAELFK